MGKLKNLYAFVGRSGIGKTTIVETLGKRYDWVQAESYTDRPKRKPDESGHIFISPQEFNNLKGLLLPTTFNGCRYAMTCEILNNSDLIVVDPKGVMDVKSDYLDKKVVVIGLHCDVRVLEKRMYHRGDSSGQVKARLEHDDVVFKDMDNLCDVIVNNNGDFDTTISLIESIIRFYESL